MNGAAVAPGLVDGAADRRVLTETPVADGGGNARKILVHDAPRADVHVAHFRITHLASGQANGFARCLDQDMRVVGPHLVPARGIALPNGVVLGLFAMAPAVQNHQDEGGALGFC